jgi:hypothetical protein
MFVTPENLHNQQQHNLSLQNVHSHLPYAKQRHNEQQHNQRFRMFTATYTTLQ